MTALIQTQATRIFKNILGEFQPSIMHKEVRDLVQDEYYNAIKLRPIYQRPMRWNADAYNDLIVTVMNNGVVPCLYMYELHPEDKVDQEQGKYDYEVVDGQHRLYALKAFVDSTYRSLPHINKEFVVHLAHETTDENGNKKVVRIFYKKTPEVEEYYWKTFKVGSPEYLTEGEKKRFDKFTIDIKLLKSKVSMDYRRGVFMDLQKGVPVRNSDYLKNQTDCKLMSEFAEHDHAQMMSVLLEHCTKKASNFWTQWDARLFLLWVRAKDASSTIEPSTVFLQSDSMIADMIKRKLHKLENFTNEQFAEYHLMFETFIELLKGGGFVLNPTQLFATFYHLCSGRHDLEIIKTHMPAFAKDGLIKHKKSMWEGGIAKLVPRQEYFNECLSQLKSMVDIAVTEYIEIIPPRKKTTKKVRTEVFDKRREEGTCAICEETEINEGKDGFEAGHIDAHKKRGANTTSNLLPMCKGCNLRMGTLNAYEYKKIMFPHTVK
jgi:hypothetical protein